MEFPAEASEANRLNPTTNFHNATYALSSDVSESLHANVGPAVCTWIHRKIGESPGEHFDLSRFFEGFSGPDFAKISAAVLRIFLVRSRAPEAKL